MDPFFPLRKVVIPAAGLGTRMLPVSEVVPKELLPVGGKPAIQYAIEEAIASGVAEVVVVTRPDKPWLVDFLTRDQKAPSRGFECQKKTEALDALFCQLRITLVEQPQPQGLGDALLCARPEIGDDTFGVILPDAIIDARLPVLAQLAVAFQEQPGSYVATQPVEPRDVHRFGMLALEPLHGAARAGSVFRVRSIVEKPSFTQTPSSFGVFGRYVFTGEIFSLLDEVAAGSCGEVQLSDALAKYCERYPLYAFCFDGRHYDVGDPSGYFRAVVDFTLKDKQIGPTFRDYLSGVLGSSPAERPADVFSGFR
ncbi:MAG TPA: sugar phosphate nucleotidyltransferase [Terriglobales bacterium]|nr:sugar phosphate nucleotidyltransferase [Terriglobales bacterium]